MFDPGSLLILFTTVTTAVAMAAYLPGVRRGPGRPLLSVARPAVYATAAGLVAASGYLWYLLLSHQFQYSYVFRYSSTDMPLRYVISAFWGGQEGTFLLWALFGGLLAVFLRFKAKHYEAPVQFFYLGVNLFLMLMMLKASPFAKLSQTPPDGNGLNPLLQDPWMTIHPPIMFFGFASLGIPAAYAMAAMVKEDWDNWVRRAIPWTIFGVMALGTGLLLGGYWAYSILGWGGFWGWDPVENSSLVPWLVAVALLHNQLIQLKRGIFKRANIFLSLMPFVLLTYSTFLTRSGILADFSVHSFTDLGINQFLVAFMAVFLGGGLGLFVFKFRRIPADKAQAPLLSREYVMFLGSLTFSLFAVFVLLGTSAPLITRLWGPASNVQPEFYNRMGLPFAVIIGLLVGVAPYLIWKNVNLRQTGRKLLWPATISLVSAPVLFLAGVRHVPYLVMIVAAIFATLANAWIVWIFLRRNWSSAGGYLAHVGIGLSILGIVASTAYSVKETVVLPKDEEVVALGYGFKFIGVREVENGRKNAYDVTLRTAQGAHLVSPTMYFSDFNQGMMKKPAIQSFLARDVYVSPIGHDVDPIEDRIQTRLHLDRATPTSVMDMTVEFLGLEIKAPDVEPHDHGDSDHAHPVQDAVATLRVERDGQVETLTPILRAFDNGSTAVVPATVSSTGQTVTLLATDTAGSHAQIGIARAPAVLGRGESATLQGVTFTVSGFDVVMPSREGGSIRVFADVHAEVGGESVHVRPGFINRPGAEKLELIEAPLGRTGLNLVMEKVAATEAKAHFQVAGTPREFLYAEVSLKPFIILLWIGTAVTLAGLVLATLQRGRIANRMQEAVAGDEKVELKKNGKRAAA